MKIAAETQWQFSTQGQQWLEVQCMHTTTNSWCETLTIRPIFERTAHALHNQTQLSIRDSWITSWNNEEQIMIRCTVHVIHKQFMVRIFRQSDQSLKGLYMHCALDRLSTWDSWITPWNNEKQINNDFDEDRSIDEESWSTRDKSSMRRICRNQPAHAHSLIYSFTHSRWRRPTHCTHVHCTVFLHIPRETHLQGQGAPKPHVGCQFPRIPPKPCPPKAKIGDQFAVTTFFVVSQQQTFFGVFQQHSSSSSNILHGYQLSRTFAKGSTSSSLSGSSSL